MSADVQYLLRELERRVRAIEAGRIRASRLKFGPGDGTPVSIEFLSGLYDGQVFAPDTDTNGEVRMPVAPAIIADGAAGSSAWLRVINAGGGPIGESALIGETDITLSGALTQTDFQLQDPLGNPISVEASPIVLSLRGRLLSSTHLTWNASRDTFTLSEAPNQGPLIVHLAIRRRAQA